MFGKDLTPVKQQMRLPGMVWGSIAMEALLQLSGQLAFENYRARLNRVFNVASEELYKPQINADKNGS